MEQWTDIEDSDGIRSSFGLRRRRDRSRKKLDQLLSRANDEAFLRMIWAADAIQSGGERARLGWSWFSERQRDLVEELQKREVPFFHKWMLESLANQLLLVPKPRILENRANKVVDCRNLAAAVDAVNLLHDLENAEDGLVLSRVNVLTQRHRHSQRQFPWQRGKVSKRSIYKSSFLYAFPEAQQRFLERHGISLDDFSLCGIFTIRTAAKPLRLPPAGRPNRPQD